MSDTDANHPGETQRQKHLVLILAREFASNLSTPTLIADERGYLVYYNEAAEDVVGRRFAETGELPLDDWLAAFEPKTLASEPLPPERRPAHIALRGAAARPTSAIWPRAWTASTARSR